MKGQTLGSEYVYVIILCNFLATGFYSGSCNRRNQLAERFV